MLVHGIDENDHGKAREVALFNVTQRESIRQALIGEQRACSHQRAYHC